MAEPDHRSEKTGKVPAVYSVYSNSYNCQTTRSHSCKSAVCRLSDSRSSGSSGYGGNPSSGSSGASESHKKKMEVETKHDNIHDLELEAVVEDMEQQKPINLSNLNINPVPVSDDLFTCEKMISNIQEDDLDVHLPQSKQEYFSCVVAMQTGMIIYSTATLCNTLGYPQEMWVGRSFIDFLNPRDQEMFSSQVSNMVKASMSMANESQSQTRVSIHCRLRKYNGLASSGFGIKTRSVAYLPFKLVLSFYAGKKENEKDISEEKKENIFGINFENFKGDYIVAQATSIVTSFKAPLEILAKGMVFTLRHSVIGVIEHIDAISIPYLGYMPHDLVGKCAIKMYHPEDLYFLRRIYETVIKVGQAPKTSFRIQTQNGDYVRVETEFTCFVNPWSKKVEYVTAQHEVIQGPCEVDVFGSPDPERSLMAIRKVRITAEIMRDQILRTMCECLAKQAEISKQQMKRKCTSNMVNKFMENPGGELRSECLENEPSLSEKDSVLIGGISPDHDLYDSASTDTSPSYNHMNYKENLQRFFDSEPTIHACVSPQLQMSTNKAFNLDRIDNVVDMEWDDDEDIFLVTNSTDNDNGQRLTQAALKTHNHEMEIALYKEHQASRHQPKKRMLLRQRLEHLERCNQFHDTNTQALARPQQQTENVKSHVIDNTEVSHNSNRDQSQCTKHPPKRECLASCKRDESVKKREFRSEKKEGKHGLKRDMTTACISEKGAPHKQIKQANSCDARYSNKNPALAFNAPVYTLWPEHTNGFPLPMASGSPQTNDPAHVWPEQISGFKSPMGRAQPQIIGQANVWAEQTNGFPLPMASGSPQTVSSNDPAHGLYQIYYLNEPISVQTTNTSNIVPFMLYSNVYGAPIVCTQLNPSVIGKGNTNNRRFAKFATNGIRNKGGRVKNSSWNILPIKEPKSSSDQENSRTEGETSSSFYSTFLKIDSSGEEQGKSSSDKDSVARNRSKCMKWVQGQVVPSNELFYRYQLPKINVKEVLEKDRQFLANVQQSVEVNDQLGRQYVDMHLQGVTSKPTLENGITSSGSSGEESGPKGVSNKGGRVKNSSWNILPIKEPKSSSDQENSRTEGETSSSFYSTFLKIDSSGEEQGKSISDKDSVARNRSKCMKWVQGQVSRTYSEDNYSELLLKNNQHYYLRKDTLVEPPWMKDVVPSNELFYRYQLPKINVKEVLEKDRQFLANVQQSVEVNDQLGQLYVDMHLQGVTSKLTLEDGITSSGSSGEESGPEGLSKQKRMPYGQMAMIFEQDAPFPPQAEIDMKDHYIPVRPLPAIVPYCSKDCKRVTTKVPKFNNLERFYKNIDGK